MVGIALVLPLAGDLIVQSAMCRVASNLALLLKSGVPMLEALTVLAGVLRTNPLYQDALWRAHARVAAGRPQASSLEETGLFTTRPDPHLHPGGTRPMRSLPSPRHGYALMQVLVFGVLFLVLLGVAYRQTASVLRVETVRVQQAQRDQGSVAAVALGLDLLETGLPPSDPYSCTVTVAQEKAAPPATTRGHWPPNFSRRPATS